MIVSRWVSWPVLASLHKRSGDKIAGGLVGADHHPGRGHLAVDELQPGRHGALSEQSLARSDQHREYPEMEAIDEVMAQQGLDQLPAAVHLELPPVARLELRDAAGHVAL